MDHWYRSGDFQITLYTVLVYFNDDFEGGETRFQEQLEQTVVPRRGLTVIFQHKIRHEGCPVLRGTKYAMRSDVIYEASERMGQVGFDHAIACRRSSISGRARTRKMTPESS